MDYTVEYSEEAKGQLETLLLRVLGSTPQMDNICIGNITPILSEDIVIKIMEYHTEDVDKKIWRIDDTEDEESLVLIDELLNFRGITYKEYKEIFTSFFEEYEYNNLKFLKAVFINDDLRRKEFIRNHENSFEGYITCLNEFNIPILDFFLRQKMKFNLPVKELLTHAYGVGMTGSGKSEVIKNIFFSLQELSNFNNKYSLVAIEPHGKLCDELLLFNLNKYNKERLMYIDPFIHKDIGIKDIYTPTINPFQLYDDSPENIRLMGQQLTKAILATMKANGELTAPMEALLKPCIDTVLKNKGDMQDLLNFMNDGIEKSSKPNDYLYKWGLKNEEHRIFFETRFYSGGFVLTKNSLYNKFSSLLKEPTFKNFVCGQSTINLEKAIDEGKVIIFRLSKGRIGDDVSETIGKFMIALMTGYAKKREYIREERHMRKTFVFIDECQNFISPVFGEIVAEMRKYMFSLLLFQQYVGQGMETDLVNNIMANSTIKFIGRAGDNPTKMSKETGIPIDKLKVIQPLQFLIQNRKRVGNEEILFEVSNLFFDRSSPYYMNSLDRRELLEYQVYQSGYYKKVPLVSEEESGEQAPKAKFEDF